jgi:hypothetical protein
MLALRAKEGATDPTARPRRLYSTLFIPAALMGLTPATFADVLFISADRVLSAQGEDTFTYFLYSGR